MSRYHDDSTSASNPVDVQLSSRSFESFWKEEPLAVRAIGRLRGLHRMFRERVAEHLSFGDSRAALVLSTSPLVVAAYTDELDCVAMLKFKNRRELSSLRAGARLLTINTYEPGSVFASDLAPGPHRYDRWINFYPIIANFLADTSTSISDRIGQIHNEEWIRCAEMAREYLSRPTVQVRNGSPLWSYRAAIEVLSANDVASCVRGCADAIQL